MTEAWRRDSTTEERGSGKREPFLADDPAADSVQGDRAARRTVCPSLTDDQYKVVAKGECHVVVGDMSFPMHFSGALDFGQLAQSKTADSGEAARRCKKS